MQDAGRVGWLFQRLSNINISRGKEKPQQSGPRLDKTFPATHIIPLKAGTPSEKLCVFARGKES